MEHRTSPGRCGRAERLGSTVHRFASAIPRRESRGGEVRKRRTDRGLTESAHGASILSTRSHCSYERERVNSHVTATFLSSPSFSFRPSLFDRMDQMDRMQEPTGFNLTNTSRLRLKSESHPVYPVHPVIGLCLASEMSFCCSPRFDHPAFFL